MSVGYYVVQIGNHLLKAYNEDELSALEEVRNVYYGAGTVNCRKALRGLFILMKRRVSPSLVSSIDKLLAEVIRNDQCRDL